jgi:RHS repeat-associated protein
VIRMNYADHPSLASTTSYHAWPEPFAIVPHWDLRGQAQSGTYGDTGARWRCMTKSGESERCVALDWSAGWFPYRPARPVFESWHGSMIEGKRDASGLLYRRNRYYDPGSGRFTQEDPIGLAGGLNLYGYAAGDPVNFSDPFGLIPCWVYDRSQCKKTGWGEAFALLGRWISGTGPEHRTFGEGSLQAEHMRSAPGVNRARDFFYSKNADNIANGNELEGVTNFAVQFGVRGLVQAGINSTQQFVGSYRVDIAVNNEAETLTFTITNTTSATSAFYRMSPSWSRSRFRPGGNMTQTITWTEEIKQ